MRVEYNLKMYKGFALLIFDYIVSQVQILLETEDCFLLRAFHCHSYILEKVVNYTSGIRSMLRVSSFRLRLSVSSFVCKFVHLLVNIYVKVLH